jgi:CubicO group peptidase (beta-lactamase class C family)
MRFVALALVLVAQPAVAADFDPKPVDEVVEKALKAFDAPGCAVVIVQDGRVVHLKGYGVREKGKSEPVTPDTVFAIASCSKAFCSALVAMLVDEGKLKWDDKVHDHLDYFRLADDAADRETTVRDLLSHRTGMPRHDMLWAGSSAGDSEAVIRRWAKAKPSTSFRSTWEYSNVPFTTAGVIAGKLEKSDWATATKARIFDPLGMKATSATAREAVAAKDHATPHYFGLDKSVTAVEWDNLDTARAAGSINSTARDLAEWLKFQLAEGKVGDKQLVARSALRETHTPQMLVKPEGPFAVYFPQKATRFSSYGLGWFVHDYKGVTCASHGGTLTGFRAQCMLVPEQKLGVFVLCNLRPSFVTEAVAKTVLDATLGLPQEDWVAFHKAQLALLDFNIAAAKKKRDGARKAETKPSLTTNGYAGRYDEPAYGTAQVTVDGAALALKWGKYTFRLEHYHFDTFTAVPVAPKADIVSFDRSTFDVQFRLGTNGELEGLKLFEQEFKRARK